MKKRHLKPHFRAGKTKNNKKRNKNNKNRYCEILRKIAPLQPEILKTKNFLKLKIIV